MRRMPLRAPRARAYGSPMKNQPARFLFVSAALAGALTFGAASPAAHAVDFGSMAQKAAGSAQEKAKDTAKEKASEGIVKKVNAKLLAEGRKNQCNFKSDSDELEKGCDAKAKKLANTLIEVKKDLQAGGVSVFKFEVSGHTDSSGKADHNKELSGKRAAAIVRELVAKGVDAKDIISVGMGSEKPLVTPDDTDAKKKKNRRYEIQVRL
ncbi:MAG: outer membrane protein precursor [Myxococcales bacterium]|nr:outer membrane protein precursor [Myxococcales bacterium]